MSSKLTEPKALIVEDEPDMCWALAHILRGMGIEPVVSMRGVEALALAKRERFQIAFIDEKLPDLDGLDLAVQLRKLDPAVHVVLISGFFYPGDREVREAIERGDIHDFISKPFENAVVQATVRRILGL